MNLVPSFLVMLPPLAWASFSITSAYVAGLNTLDFVVHSGGTGGG